MKRLAVLLAALLLCLGTPSLAVAQLGPQNVPDGLTQDDSDPETINLDEDGGFSSLQIALTFGGAIVIVSLIAWLILRDARGKAAAVARGRTSTSPAGKAVAASAAKKSAREREREQARKRAKAKAARGQRKRNRPR